MLTGRLKTSPGNLLPFNTEGQENAGGADDPTLFVAGDIRANEQIYLAVMHTLFVREHNRLADEIAATDPTLTGEEIYQRARKIVGALLQVITYKEWLPLLLGPDAIPPYKGYDPTVNAGIANEFSSAAFRFGHSMLSNELLCIDAAGNPGAPCLNAEGIRVDSLPLADVFFRPELLATPGQDPEPESDVIDPFLRGLAAQTAQEVDIKVVSAVRNFLFGPLGAGGQDLAAFNIQRGRDHGLARLNETRMAYGLTPHKDFDNITSNRAIQRALKEAYDSVDDIELWPGGLAEDHVHGGLVGETFHTIVVDQFIRLRDGDRFWYQNDPFFTSNLELTEEVENTKLSAIIRRNTAIGDEMQDNVFIWRKPGQ